MQKENYQDLPINWMQKPKERKAGVERDISRLNHQESESVIHASIENRKRYTISYQELDRCVFDFKQHLLGL